MSVLSEDSRSITPPVRIGKIDGLLKGVNADDLHDWSEDFFFVAINTRTHVVDDGWADEVAIRVSLNLHTSAVENNLAVLGTVFDEALDFGLVLFVVHRANIRIVPTSTHRHLFRFFNDLGNPLLRITDQDDHGKGHASLARGAEASSDHSIDGISLITVWHHDAMILCTHVDLRTLAMSAGSRVDVLSSRVCSNEANAFDIWVRADLCDSITTTLDDIDDAIGDA